MKKNGNRNFKIFLVFLPLVFGSNNSRNWRNALSQNTVIGQGIPNIEYHFIVADSANNRKKASPRHSLSREISTCSTNTSIISFHSGRSQYLGLQKSCSLNEDEIDKIEMESAKEIAISEDEEELFVGIPGIFQDPNADCFPYENFNGIFHNNGSSNELRENMISKQENLSESPEHNTAHEDIPIDYSMKDSLNEKSNISLNNERITGNLYDNKLLEEEIDDFFANYSQNDQLPDEDKNSSSTEACHDELSYPNPNPSPNINSNRRSYNKQSKMNKNQPTASKRKQPSTSNRTNASANSSLIDKFINTNKRLIKEINNDNNYKFDNSNHQLPLDKEIFITVISSMIFKGNSRENEKLVSLRFFNFKDDFTAPNNLAIKPLGKLREAFTLKACTRYLALRSRAITAKIIQNRKKYDKADPKAIFEYEEKMIDGFLNYLFNPYMPFKITESRNFNEIKTAYKSFAFNTDYGYLELKSSIGQRSFLTGQPITKNSIGLLNLSFQDMKSYSLPASEEQLAPSDTTNSNDKPTSQFIKNINEILKILKEEDVRKRILNGFTSANESHGVYLETTCKAEWNLKLYDFFTNGVFIKYLEKYDGLIRRIIESQKRNGKRIINLANLYEESTNIFMKIYTEFLLSEYIDCLKDSCKHVRTSFPEGTKGFKNTSNIIRNANNNSNSGQKGKDLLSTFFHNCKNQASRIKDFKLADPTDLFPSQHRKYYFFISNKSDQGCINFMNLYHKFWIYQEIVKETIEALIDYLIIYLNPSLCCGYRCGWYSIPEYMMIFNFDFCKLWEFINKIIYEDMEFYEMDGYLFEKSKFNRIKINNANGLEATLPNGVKVICRLNGNIISNFFVSGNKNNMRSFDISANSYIKKDNKKYIEVLHDGAWRTQNFSPPKWLFDSIYKTTNIGNKSEKQENDSEQSVKKSRPS